MITTADTDSQTWILTGLDTCDVNGCHNCAVIVAKANDYDRFCEVHLDIAARVALHYPVFPGWYRIDDSSTSDGQLVVEVHPL
jgi:hypothetical protein